MKRKSTILKTEFFISSVLILLGLVLIFSMPLITSCGFTAQDSYDICIDSTQLKHEALDIVENINRVIIKNDSIEIVHGHVIAKDKWTSGINVFLNLPVDRMYDKATVILNGWNLSFTGGKGQVMYVGAAVGNMKLDPGLLTWNAVGVLRNEDDTREIEGKFYYTILLWKSAKVQLITNEGNIKDLCKSHHSGGNSFFGSNNDGMNTALASKITSIKLEGFPTRGLKGMLPRGFLMSYSDNALFGGSDHNLAQLAYRMGEVATTDDKTDPRRMVDSAYISWRSDFIIKDDDDRRDFRIYETVSAIAGSDLGYIQPPYSILPSEDPGWASGCLASAGNTEIVEYSVQNIPYQYGIPLLTGWNLESFCGDEPVKSIGVYIEDWNYTFMPNSALGGNLIYKLVTTIDSGSGDAFIITGHHVSVLGIISIANKLK